MAIKMKRKAVVKINECVACGACMKICPMSAIQIPHGIYAEVSREKCVGCGKCEKECPASVIEIKEVDVHEN